MANTM